MNSNGKQLGGKKVAMLATDGFEQSELAEPLKALRDAGATVELVALKPGKIRGWDEKDWGESFDVDKTVKEANAAGYDGLVLPGGVMNPDTLRTSKDALSFVRAFFDAGKPVAAICHGPQVLIECGVVKGRRMTSYPSISTDLKNAGADWVDREVVTDNGLTTSRSPKDLPAFCTKMIEEIAEGRHQPA